MTYTLVELSSYLTKRGNKFRLYGRRSGEYLKILNKILNMWGSADFNLGIVQRNSYQMTYFEHAQTTLRTLTLHWLRELISSRGLR